MNLSPQHHKHRLPTPVPVLPTHKKLLPGTPMTSATAASSTSIASKKKLNATATHSFSKHITIDILRPHFDKPLAEVAKLFGICTTLMKKVCRRVGIPRWPHRHIRSLRKSILSMETASSMFDGVDRTAYDIQIRKQQKRLAMLLYNPNAIDMDDEDMENDDENVMSAPESASTTSDSRHTSPALAPSLHSLPQNCHSLFPSPDLPHLDLGEATFGRTYTHRVGAPSLPRLPSISTWFG